MNACNKCTTIMKGNINCNHVAFYEKIKSGIQGGMDMKKYILFLCTTVAMLFLLMACSSDTPSTNNNDKNPKNNTDDTKEDEQVDAEITLPNAPLQKGDENDQVASLQQVLETVGYSIETSGKFDDLTTWALTDIQLQADDLYATGMYETETKNQLQKILDDDATVEVGKALEKPQHPGEFPDIVENPYDILAVANKEHALPSDYEPNDLVVPDIRFPFEEDHPKKQMRQIAANSIEELIAAGDEAGVSLFGQSGYRSYDRQVAIFASNTEQHGEDHANTYSAKAGESEHQTGLVMDVTSQAVGFDLNTDFGETEEGQWLQEHAHEFGFIIRYPEDKVDITEYQYEPWHIRYVGEKAATAIYKKQETLEEYSGLK